MNLQEKKNHNQNFSEFSETEAINLKKVASFFQDTIHFHPGHLQPKTSGEEWGENEKDWVEKVGKGNGGCFSCSYDRIVGAGKRLVFFLPRKRILVDF